MLPAPVVARLLALGFAVTVSLVAGDVAARPEKREGRDAPGAVKAKPGAGKTEPGAAKEGDEEAKPPPTSRVLARGDAAADEEKAEDPLRKLDRPRHIEIRARDMRLRASSIGRLERVAARYHAATRARLVVTGGYRSPRRQAELMASKLADGEDIAALYAEKGAAAEIRDAYLAGVERKQPRSQLVEIVLGVIDAQIARGVFVSLHLQGRAADVRSRGMTAAQIDALKSAIEAEPGTVMVDERDGESPHFHLKL